MKRVNLVSHLPRRGILASGVPRTLKQTPHMTTAPELKREMEDVRAGKLLLKSSKIYSTCAWPFSYFRQQR